MKLTDNPDEVCFAIVLLCCSHAGKIRGGIQRFLAMSFDFSVAVTRNHYCCLIDLFGRTGHLAEAADLIAHMPFEPDSLELRCLLGACRTHGNLEHGARVASFVLGLRGEECASSYVFLASIYTHALKI
ncbi:hypothetical protein SELMODRAFT_80719 [Selaginella moellendorffii]|uniref:Pentacotripeptide-repeat region of PRORP domain-containing protein n=2 Tax=Selaginella moellendorffii TaxID=88036 RepID=D8QYG7_SELML|nr:hypothetical protein SELMODRAFT_80719 [Selaginella moellendorffii]